MALDRSQADGYVNQQLTLWSPSMTRDPHYMTTSSAHIDVPQGRHYPSPHDADGPKDSLVLDVLRKRWWIFVLCLFISGAAAFFLATEFRSESWTVRGSLIYQGLPLPPGPNVYEPPSLRTYKEILFSTTNMEDICNAHGLKMPPTKLAAMFECEMSRGSSIMELQLTWPNAEDGIKLVNAMMDSLIAEAAERRNQTLNNHHRYLFTARGHAQDDMLNATDRLLKAQRDWAVGSGTGDGRPKDAASLTAQLSQAQAQLEELEVTRLSIEQQLARLDQQIRANLEQVKRAAIEPRLQFVEESAKQIRKGHNDWKELQQLHEQFSDLLRESVQSKDEYLAWKQKLVGLGPTLMPPAASFETAQTIAAASRLDSLLGRQEQLRVELIPLDNREILYKNRMERLQAMKTDAQGNASGDNLLVGSIDGEFLEEQRELAAAESRFALLSQQLQNIELIRDCQTKEFAVETTASMATAVVDSNRKKLFVLFFAASMAVLAMPVFGIEWLASRESPVARFAGRWGLPVIAERLLSNYSLGKGENPDWRFDEAVRMTTLRIQQCANRSGFVVLMSNLAKAPPPVRLMSAIAECLAHREERVLIVDAMCPSHHRLPSKRAGQKRSPHAIGALQRPERGVSANPQSKAGTSTNDNNIPSIRRFGLSDFLSRECEEAADLIQPTSCAGVDQISAGDVEFPHEAMASSCITELFEHCRKTYSIILVAGPPVTARADFQLLAARADGIMLAVNRAAVNEPANRAAVQDLIELQAPMLGVVG